MERFLLKKTAYLTILTWLIIIAAWLGVTESGMVDSVLLPSPRKVLDTFRVIAIKGYNNVTLMMHLGISFKRLFVALFFAIVTAIPLGLISGFSKRFRAIIDSVVQFYRPLPPLAYYTLLVFWMGIDDSSKVMLLFLAAFAPIYLTCVSSVTNVNEDFILNARSLGASRQQVFYYVVLPSSLPQIFVGVRTAVGFAYTTLVSAEMVAGTSGIGWMVIDASRYLKSDVIFVGIIIMGITGILMDLALQYFENKLVYWKGKV